jgi:hypothetical protein
VSETYTLSRAQLAHMRELSRWHLRQANPWKPKPVAPGSPPERVRSAKEWLADLLTPDPMLATTVHTRAFNEGRTPKSIRKARKALGVVVFQRSRAWWWALPDSDDRADEGLASTPLAAG